MMAHRPIQVGGSPIGRNPIAAKPQTHDSAMGRTILSLAAWLALVVHVLAGVAPAQPLVVCLRADGSVGLEFAEQGRCAAPCDDAGDPSRRVGSAEADCCPCIDVPLPGRIEQPQAKPENETRFAVPLILPRAEATIVQDAATHGHRLLVCARPRPGLRLALLRTVILRV
jgi:hypothetical protein